MIELRRAGLVTVWLIGCGSVKTSSPDAAPHDSDAAPDGTDAAIVATKYDVAYINDITVTPDITSIFSFLLVVNNGSAPLKLATASVVTFSDDSAGIVWELGNNGTTTATLSPGRAAGLLSPDAAAKIVGSGLVTEPIEDNLLNFEMTFPEPPASGVTLRAQAVLQVENANVVLPFTIKIVANGAPQFNSAGRVKSQ